MVVFCGAEFSGGAVDFDRAQFSGGKVASPAPGSPAAKSDFLGARFSGGKVDFSGAEFSGGTVDFSMLATGHSRLHSLGQTRRPQA